MSHYIIYIQFKGQHDFYRREPRVAALFKRTIQWGWQVMISEKHTHDKLLIPNAHHAARLLTQPCEQAT